MNCSSCGICTSFKDSVQGGLVCVHEHLSQAASHLKQNGKPGHINLTAVPVTFIPDNSAVLYQDQIPAYYRGKDHLVVATELLSLRSIVTVHFSEDTMCETPQEPKHPTLPRANFPNEEPPQLGSRQGRYGYEQDEPEEKHPRDE